ncbi:MAG: LamG-like jellyroll fold domain-containing protein [Streptosporangiaceae bacterium]
MSQRQEPIKVEQRKVGGRYLLIAKLGSGGYGNVWQAMDTMLDVDVAAKQLILPPGLPEHARIERLTRARREATNAARLRGNPNIVSVHDLVIDNGEPWLIMELIHGRSLAQHMAGRGPMAVDEAARIGRAVLSALVSSHAAGIIHRDIKPANVMLSFDSRIVLTDFGISMLVTDDNLTLIGQFIGTVDYMAPERITGNSARPASDMFSLGTLLYHMVEGRPPFSRDTANATIEAVLHENPIPPARAGNLAPLITALLNKDPAARPSAEDALRALDERDTTTATFIVQASRPAHDAAPAKVARRRGRTILLSCCALVLAGAAITVFASHHTTAASSPTRTTSHSHARTATHSVTGPVPLAIWQQTESFNGTSSATSLPDVALDTGPGASFTVSAWVYLTSTGAFATAVSQDGTVDSSFYLQYAKTDNAWAFSRVASDGTNPTGIRALSSIQPTTNQWVHLVGVYSAPAGLLTLYVNGNAQGTATDTTPFAGQGGLVIGRAEYNSGPTDWFPGMIKDIEVFQQALSAAQIQALP